MLIRDRSLPARLERFSRARADLKGGTVLGAYGVGLHVVLVDGSTQPRIVPSLQGRETWPPGARVTLATYAGKSGPAIIGKAPAGQQGGADFAARRYPAGPAPATGETPLIDFLAFKWVNYPTWDRMAVARWRDGAWLDSPDWYAPGDMDATWTPWSGEVFLRGAEGLPSAVAGTRGLLGGLRIYVVDPGAAVQYQHTVNPDSFLAWNNPGPWTEPLARPLWDGSALYWLELEQTYDGIDASEFQFTREMTAATYRLWSSDPTLASPLTVRSFVRSSYPAPPTGKHLYFVTNAPAAAWIAGGTFHVVLSETLQYTDASGSVEAGGERRIYLTFALNGSADGFAESSTSYEIKTTGDLQGGASLAAQWGESPFLVLPGATDSAPTVLWPGTAPFGALSGEIAASVGKVGSIAAAYLLKYDPENSSGGTTARVVTGTVGAPEASTPVLPNPAWAAAEYAGGFPDLMFPVERS